MTEWHRIERGTGRPLVLLHGGGASARCWLPVLDLLGEHRRAIALDFPGFGDTPAPGPELSIEWIVDQLAVELRRLGIEGPVDLAGNSMGGFIALEAAKRGMARSVVGLAPVMLWDKGKTMPLALRAQFQSALLNAPVSRTPARAIFGNNTFRRFALGAAVGHPEHMTTAEAITFVQDFDHSAPTMRRVLRIAKHLRFEGGAAITVPVTIAFGTRDRMLPPSTSQFRAELPTQTKWLDLPGCGHVPMWDAPELIARTILEGSSEQWEQETA